MDRKFLIVLLATIFYNGVTHSSPIEVQRTSEAGPPEEKPPTPTKFNNTSVLGHDSQAKNETAHKDTQTAVQVDGKSATQNASIVQVKTPTTAAINATSPESKSAATIPESKSTATIPESKSPSTESTTANQTSEHKNTSQAIDAHNATQPATSDATGKNETAVVPGGKNGKETPTPAQTTTVSSTSTMATSTTTKVPGTKPTESTVTPTTVTTKDSSVMADQGTPAPPVQEKHFDGPSFFGGIVLTIGLTAIGFIAFKYYKSGKIDMSYRTL